MTICNRTPTSTAEARQFIAERMAYFDGQIEVLPGLPEKITPPKRSDWIDPDAMPRRKAPAKKRRLLCGSEKLEHQREMRRRGNKILRQEWPELNLAQLAAEAGVHITTINYRLGMGATLEKALRKGRVKL